MQITLTALLLRRSSSSSLRQNEIKNGKAAGSFSPAIPLLHQICAKLSFPLPYKILSYQMILSCPPGTRRGNASGASTQVISLRPCAVGRSLGFTAAQVTSRSALWRGLYFVGCWSRQVSGPARRSVEIRRFHGLPFRFSLRVRAHSNGLVKPFVVVVTQR
jgi:hypothetical protein